MGTRRRRVQGISVSVTPQFRLHISLPLSSGKDFMLEAIDILKGVSASHKHSDFHKF